VLFCCAYALGMPELCQKLGAQAWRSVGPVAPPTGES